MASKRQYKEAAAQLEVPNLLGHHFIFLFWWLRGALLFVYLVEHYLNDFPFLLFLWFQIETNVCIPLLKWVFFFWLSAFHWGWTCEYLRTCANEWTAPLQSFANLLGPQHWDIGDLWFS
jgi:hypothetical protein